jgi:hypothetical protein
VTRRLRLPRNADVFGLYLLLGLALLAPLASNDILPRVPDHANHTAFVVEGRSALDEGQLPLRVAPFAADGLRYPLFQFYAQTPYLITAILYQFVTPTNPWIPIKLTYLAGLCLAGFFTFKLAHLIGFDRTSSALCGIVYMTAPYLLVNIHARGAFTEAFAQCLLPIIGLASARAVLRDRPMDLAWAALAWSLLGTSHLITFFYGTLFFGLFAAGLVVTRQLSLARGVRLLLPCLLGWGLSAFQWYPAATVHVKVHDYLGDPFTFQWLTPLSGLLSFTSVPPEPAGRAVMSPYLHPAIGAPILIAVAGLLYFRRLDRWPSRTIALCLILFGAAFFATWSPIHFWAWLPPQLLVVQFSYRLLTFTTVFGTMLAAYFLDIYRERYGLSSVLPWLVGILAFTQSYLPPDRSSERTLASIITAPKTDTAAEAYEWISDPGTPPGGLPLVRLADARRQCGLDRQVLKCTFNFDAPAAVQLPMLFYPTLLRVTVDGSPVSYFPSAHDAKRLVTVAVEPGRHRIFATFRGSPIGNAISWGTILAIGLLVVGPALGRRLRPRVRASARADGGTVSTADRAHS